MKSDASAPRRKRALRQRCHGCLAACRKVPPRSRFWAMTKFFTRFVRDDSGVTAIEYGLIGSLISIMCIGAATFAGQQLLALFNNIGNALAGAL